MFLHLIDKYEELNLTNYMEGDTNKMVLGDAKNKELKASMDHMAENLKNPFYEMYHWCKGEIYDLQALAETIVQRDIIEKDIKKLESKKKNTQSDLDHVQTGKKTIRTILKTEKDTGTMVNSIEHTEKELENLQALLELVTIYLGEEVIPLFKNEKLNVYSRLMQQFNVMEINNAHQIASFWSNVLSIPYVKQATEAK